MKAYSLALVALLLLIVPAILPLISPVRASSVMWSKTYTGKPYETAESVIETSDGGFVLAGWVWSPSGMMLLKTDNLGKLEWKQTYGNGEIGHEKAYSVVETSDGGYAVAGYTLVEDNDRDCWLVKTDAKGNMKWNRTYGGTKGDEAYSVIQTTDGGFALAGGTSSYSIGECDFWLIKTNSQGKSEWRRTFGGTEWEKAYCLIETSDGGYAIAGVKQLGLITAEGFWLVKTDAQGNMEWNQTYAGEFAFSASLVEATDGGYALANAGLLIKTDANGVMEWNQTYPGLPIYSAKTSLVKTSDGGYALAGHESLIKTDAQGVVEWTQVYGGTISHSIQSLIETSDGGYALAGYKGDYTDPFTHADFWLIKTDEYGIIPEFPSWTSLLITLVAAVTVTICYRCMLRKQSEKN